MSTTTLDPTTAVAVTPTKAEPTLPERVRRRWAGMSGKLGLGSVALGFLLMAVAWNGAAGLDYTQGQVPYLLSAGLPGLGFVVLGAALLIVENARRDRAILERLLTDLVVQGRTGGTTTTVAGNGTVLAGRTSFHRPTCDLVEVRDDVRPMTPEEATAAGLTPCRLCNP